MSSVLQSFLNSIRPRGKEDAQLPDEEVEVMIPCFKCGRDYISCGCSYNYAMPPEDEIKFLEMMIMRDTDNLKHAKGSVESDMCELYLNRIATYQKKLEELMLKVLRPDGGS